MNFLQPFRSKAKGVPDLLNWAALVDDGVILCKDGALLSAFFYRGEDSESSTNERLNLVSRRVNDALTRLGTGWALWFDSVRMPVAAYSDPAASHFADPITHLIDEERRATALAEGEHYETENVLCVMWTPPIKASSKLADFVYDDDNSTKDDLAKKHHQNFERVLGELQDNLSDVLEMRRLKSFRFTDDHGREHLQDELVNYLHFVLTGLQHGINIPPVPMYLDALIGGQELYVGDTPKIGDNFQAVVAIEGFPAESMPGILDLMNHMAIPYRFTTRFLPLDLVEAMAILKKGQRRWKQAERGFISQVMKQGGPATNLDAVAMTAETEAAMTDAQSALVAFGYYTPTITLTGPVAKDVLADARTIAAEIRKLGFATRVETVNAMEAWLGSLPGHVIPNVRRPLVHSLAVADMAPLSIAWPGLPENPCPFYEEGSPPLLQGATSGATPFRLNLHVGDLGHTLVFGPTGAGKSVLLSTIAAQFRRYRGATITAFDKGNSMLPLVLASGGKHYDLSPDNEQSPKLCPLQHLDTPGDAAWAEEWIATCFALSAGKQPTPGQRKEIHRAISLMRQASYGRSLTNFVGTVQDEEIREALNHYTITGALGDLLDAEQDGLAGADFSVFEIEDLMNLGAKNMIPVLLYLFRRFEKSLTGQPALLILDEAWLMLGNDVFRDKIREWLKVLRKANCAVVIATQSLSDAQASGIMDVLRESCPTKIFLPNEEAGLSGSDQVLGPRDLYLGLGLNERELDILAYATKKKHYYYVSPLGRRLFTLELGPLTLAFVAVSDKEGVKRVKALHAAHGPAWPYEWLRERGVSYQRYQSEDYRHAA
ncbi:transporter [Brevundimonas nasdae]|uniref:Transporter n=1 Tax=Brevundimonas nasdae TaxID=172043 RepID=A0A0B4CUU8_9CAUL|nr:transporter [Brevundimonas nasdae]KIC55880.1 transporter [Brevundimonas nasdae]